MVVAVVAVVAVVVVVLVGESGWTLEQLALVPARVT